MLKQILRKRKGFFQIFDTIEYLIFLDLQTFNNDEDKIPNRFPAKWDRTGKRYDAFYVNV